MNTSKEVALKAKEQELRESVNRWMEESGLFNLGDRIEIKLWFFHDSPVDVKTRDSKTRRYHNIGTELSEQDWQNIFGSLRSKKHIPELSRLKERSNEPTDCINSYGINISMKNAGLNFRIRHVGRNPSDTDYLCQIFKVQPEQ